MTKSKVGKKPLVDEDEFAERIDACKNYHSLYNPYWSQLLNAVRTYFERN